MQTLQQIFHTIQTLFDNETFLSEPKQLYAPIDYTLRLGGKRLRPALLLASCEMMDGDRRDAESAAVGIETFHNFTLLHDDVMDRSPLRRGKATVWAKWNTNTAILSGDTMYAVAWRYFLRQPHKNLHAILNCFNETAIEVCEGQQYDMEFESRSDVSIDEYMSMIRKKTAVLLAGAMKIGALYADASAEDLQRIYNCGIDMGLAFQIQDDLLDAYGDQQTFGKPVGQDIRDHKKTYLYLNALEIAPTLERKKLEKLYSTNTHTEQTVDEILRIYDDLGIKSVVTNAIDRLLASANDELLKINAPKENKKPLHDIMSKLANRQH